MDILVSDSSVLIDLERGNLLPPCFDLPYQFSVPDILFERELKDYGGAELVRLGLQIVESDEAVSAKATTYARQARVLSAPDSFSLALASTNGWRLLAGDGELRKMAKSVGVDCHGVLWVVDEISSRSLTDPETLLEGLILISEHPRCRLPKAAVEERISSLRKAIG